MPLQALCKILLLHDLHFSEIWRLDNDAIYSSHSQNWYLDIFFFYFLQIRIKRGRRNGSTKNSESVKKDLYIFKMVWKVYIFYKSLNENFIHHS